MAQPAAHPPAAYQPAANQPAGYQPVRPAATQAALTYPTAPYPTAGFPPPSAAPAKNRSGAAITFAILAAVFVLVAAGMIVLYLGRSSDLSAAKKNNSATVQRDNGKITDLQDQLRSATQSAAAAKQTSDGQITELKNRMKVFQTCVNDVNTAINATSESAFNKAYDKMVKACVIAKAES